MPWAAAAVSAVGTVASTAISSNAAQDAANQQVAAAGNATAAQMAMYDQIQQNLSPYMVAGTNALNQYQAMVNQGFNFTYNPTNDPLYNFMQQQGTNAITSQASALDGLNSGATLKALQSYGQNTALSSYQTELSNALAQYQTNLGGLQSLASLGENAAANLGNTATNTGNSIAKNIIDAGNAQAAGTIGSANALSSGITSLFNNNSFLNAFQGIGNQASLNVWANPSSTGSNSLMGYIQSVN